MGSDKYSADFIIEANLMALLMIFLTVAFVVIIIKWFIFKLNQGPKDE